MTKTARKVILHTITTKVQLLINLITRIKIAERLAIGQERYAAGQRLDIQSLSVTEAVDLIRVEPDRASTVVQGAAGHARNMSTASPAVQIRQQSLVL